mgnify:CR=1 FL=1
MKGMLHGKRTTTTSERECFNMTTEDYKRLLSVHDWQYQKARTASEFERGSRQRDFLLSESKNNAEWRVLYLAERLRINLNQISA